LFKFSQTKIMLFGIIFVKTGAIATGISFLFNISLLAIIKPPESGGFMIATALGLAGA
jgi:hypothetical protein